MNFLHGTAPIGRMKSTAWAIVCIHVVCRQTFLLIGVEFDVIPSCHWQPFFRIGSNVLTPFVQFLLCHFAASWIWIFEPMNCTCMAIFSCEQAAGPCEPRCSKAIVFAICVLHQSAACPAWFDKNGTFLREVCQTPELNDNNAHFVHGRDQSSFLAATAGTCAFSSSQ